MSEINLYNQGYNLNAWKILLLYVIITCDVVIKTTWFFAWMSQVVFFTYMVWVTMTCFMLGFFLKFLKLKVFHL